jgi:hypothetical protein
LLGDDVAVACAIGTVAIVGVAIANAYADVDDACSDVDALSDAFDIVAYDGVDDADANANMLNDARHLAGAYVNVVPANVAAIA